MRNLGFALLLTSLAAQAQSGVEQDIQRCSSMADGAQRLECYDALARRHAETTSPADDFGKPRSPPKEADSIQSRLVGDFSGWQSGTVFTLENGQVWKYIGDSDAYYPKVPPNPEIVISKSYFGAYWMEITAIGRKVKVKRIK